MRPHSRGMSRPSLPGATSSFVCTRRGNEGGPATIVRLADSLQFGAVTEGCIALLISPRVNKIEFRRWNDGSPSIDQRLKLLRGRKEIFSALGRVEATPAKGLKHRYDLSHRYARLNGGRNGRVYLVQVRNQTGTERVGIKPI